MRWRVPEASDRGIPGGYFAGPVVEAVRMYRGAAPERPLHRIYGVTSFALG